MVLYLQICDALIDSFDIRDLVFPRHHRQPPRLIIVVGGVENVGGNAQLDAVSANQVLSGIIFPLLHASGEKDQKKRSKEIWKEIAEVGVVLMLGTLATML